MQLNHSLQACPQENPGVIWWALRKICQVLPESVAELPMMARWDKPTACPGERFTAPYGIIQGVDGRREV